MLIPTIIMGVLAISLLTVGYSKGQGQHIEGVKGAFKLTLEIFPMLVFAFIVAGMASALIPHEVISKWVGAEAGLRGILLGSIAGGITPGGPFVNFPVAASLLHAGAGIGTIVAFITGWSLWAVARLPLEVGIIGWKVTAIRLVCVLLFPPLAGLIAHWVFGNVKLP